MISNSLDIDFIHGDIHGRSCKKPQFTTDEFLTNFYEGDSMIYASGDNV